ncbi:MAG: hypothetical protein ACXQS8_06885 [Candidatus Helarchaeales archaeon]
MMSTTFNTQPNYWLNEFAGQFPELLPDYWLPLVRVFDAFEEPNTFSILPPQKTPYAFKWRIFVDPAGMSPMMMNEMGTTPMTGQRAVYESFETRFTKEGFYITQKELDFGLPNIIQMETRRVIRDINRRTEYVNLQALQGNTWNTQFTGRMSTMTRPTWQNSGGTPIRDVLTISYQIWRMCGERPDTMFLGPGEYMFLQDHATILQYLGLGSGMATPNDLLCSDLVQCIKNLTIKTINGFYKEDPTDYALYVSGNARAGQPGLGDTTMDTTTAPNKHWLLQDRAIITAGQVGFTGIAKNVDVSARQWEDEDLGVLKWKFERYFTPVIEDYGKIGVITFTGTSRDQYGHITQL